MKRANSNTTTIILVIVLIVGLSLLLYPSVSDYWNSFRQSRAITNYMEQVNQLDRERYEALLNEARAYNASLAEMDFSERFDLTEEELAEHRSMLGATPGNPIGYVEIEAIRLSLPIYLGSSESILQVGVGALEGASLPVGGESTHAALTGHRGLPTSTLFTNLDQLTQGDLFHIHVLNEILTYEVDQILIVLPHEMESLEITEGEDYCTLITCTPYGINTHRLLVRGHRIETPADAVFLQVTPDAMQIEPLVIAPLVAVPVLIGVLIWLAFGGKGKGAAKTTNSKPTAAKKKGGSSDE